MLDDRFGKGDTKVICPITDAFVGHHGALGGFVRVYCQGRAKPREVIAAIAAIPGVEQALGRDDVCRLFDLPPDREGDVAVISRVDVCIGGKEVKSNLRYGRWVEKTVAPGEHTVRFRLASPGTCKGPTLARRAFDLGADADRTVVATSRNPNKVVVFNNRLAPAPVGNTDWISFRQASDIGSVVASFTQGQVVEPSAPETFAKGQQWRLNLGAGAEIPLMWAVYRPSKATPFLGPVPTLTFAPRRHEVILVGTRTSNAKLVTIVRPTIAP